jgi:hypothetical protein
MEKLNQYKPQLISDYRHGISELNLEETIEITGGSLDDIWKATLGALITVTYNFGKSVGGWLERLFD